MRLPESEMEITEDGTLVEKEMSFNTRDALQAKLAKTAKPEDLTTDIIAMLSPEGERVNLGKVDQYFIVLYGTSLKLKMKISQIITSAKFN